MRSITTIAIVSLAVASFFGQRLLSEGTPAGGAATASDSIAARYTSELEAASAAYDKASEAIRAESTERYTAAKAAYDDAAQRSRDAYLKALEQELSQETKAGNQTAAEALRQKIDYAVNGPPRTEVQKLWVASYAAEQAQDYEAALKAVEKLIQTTGNAKNAFTQLRLGWLHLLNNQYEQSEAAYKTSASLAPRSITPRQGLVSCYLAAKRPDDAINAAREVLKLDPLNYQANKTLGDLLYAKEDYARAGAYYQRLTTAHADDLQVAASLGWCYVKLDQKPLALQIFSDVLAVQPDNVMAGNGFVAANEQRTDSASGTAAGAASSVAVAADKDKIVLRNPNNSERAVSYTLNGQYPVTLEPGRDQTLDASRAWTIRFDSGAPGNPAPMRLQAGIYAFGGEGKRWKLSRQ